MHKSGFIPVGGEILKFWKVVVKKFGGLNGDHLTDPVDHL